MSENMTIIDFHTHAFPDTLAEKVIPMLEQKGSIKASLDGKISSLLTSMDRAGIAISIVSSIATRVSQFEPILNWSLSIASDRLIPFTSLHPKDPAILDRIEQIHDAHIAGIKLHPYYQDFSLDDESMFPVYEKIARLGLILLVHTGFDLVYGRKRLADPVKTVHIFDTFPSLKLVTSHLGAWQDWDEAEKHILGKPIYMDVSYTIEFIGEKRAKNFLLNHPKDFLLFGSDSPWGEQKGTIALLNKLELPQDLYEAICCKNAERLLKLTQDRVR
ncbi:MAG: amidohydrolase family protein [Spirochaetota bacterium]